MEGVDGAVETDVGEVGGEGEGQGAAEGGNGVGGVQGRYRADGEVEEAWGLERRLLGDVDGEEVGGGGQEEVGLGRFELGWLSGVHGVLKS